jgi:hypothetical protein
MWRGRWGRVVPGKKLVGDPVDLKPAVASPRIDAIIDLISEEPHFAGERITVNLGEVGPALIDARCLERFPASFCAVICQVGGHGMSVDLWIKFAAGVVMIHGEHDVSGHPVIVCPALTNTSGGVGLELSKGFGNGLFVCIDEAFVSSQHGHDGYRFRRRECEVVQMPCVRLSRAIGGDPVGALPLTQKCAGLRIKALAQSFKRLELHLAGKSQQFGSVTLPVAHDTLAFRVVIAVFKMPG